MPHFTTNIPIVIVNQDGSRISASLNWENIIILINDGVTVTLNGRKLDAALAQNELNKLRLLHDEPAPTPTPTPISVNPQSVLQSLGSFTIQNDRVTGSINFITGAAFSPILFGKNLKSFVEFFALDPVTKRKGVTLRLKENRLHFTETERDETLNFNESAFGEEALLISSQVVWVDSNGIFHPVSVQTNFTAKAPRPPPDEPPDFEPPEPEPPGRFQGDIFTSVAVGLVALGAIIGFKKRFEK